jgi:cytochrome oxidase assembly protein ShyY1
VYRFLLTPRWLAAAVLAVAAALVMVRLGEWQLHRYEERHAINTRIDAADSTRAVPLTSVVAPPTVSGKAGASPGNSVAWTKVTFTGQYDPSHEIQARGRTVDGDVGFEIVTPLLLSDGNAVLVDRGWVPAPDAGALAAPTVPPAPTGQVTVVGQIHLSESRPTPIEHRDGRLDTRRISVPRLAGQMPFPVYGAYVLLTDQTPPNDKAFSEIPIDHEDDWQNAGYTVQWWLFACMALYAYVWYARKEAQLRSGAASAPADAGPPTPANVVTPANDASPANDVTPDRKGAEKTARKQAEKELAERKRAEKIERIRAEAMRKAPVDRVEEADRKRAEAEAKRKLAAPSGQD